MESRPKTVFCDIDGVLLEHKLSLPNILLSNSEDVVLPMVYEKLDGWERKGYNIILTTGRKECMRKFTEQQLESLGIIYDQLIMGIGGGIRILINDLKPNSDQPTAIAINLKRDEGPRGVEL